jgi:hypothetical protein
MAYREMRRMDIDQVIRRWLAGEGIRSIGRSTGLDRNTVRRIVHLAKKAGVQGQASLAASNDMTPLTTTQRRFESWLNPQ